MPTDLLDNSTHHGEYPSLGYLTRRQPPGTGIPPGSDWAGETDTAVEG
ncbi:MAG TPA: hypothetical protein VM286_09490 [Candidatus Thermoplasmatota archaeon]|nr:hypothetical protein [Candidatus Thermoplasmatota archaeon]